MAPVTVKAGDEGSKDDTNSRKRRNNSGSATALPPAKTLAVEKLIIPVCFMQVLVLWLSFTYLLLISDSTIPSIGEPP